MCFNILSKHFIKIILTTSWKFKEFDEPTMVWSELNFMKWLIMKLKKCNFIKLYRWKTLGWFLIPCDVIGTCFNVLNNFQISEEKDFSLYWCSLIWWCDVVGKGQNVKNHFVESLKKNIKSQKVHCLIKTSKVFIKLIRTSKVTKMEDDHNIEIIIPIRMSKIRTSQIRTSKIRTSKIRTLKIRTLKIRTSKRTLKVKNDFWLLTKKSERQKLKRATTYGILPKCTKACGGLG